MLGLMKSLTSTTILSPLRLILTLAVAGLWAMNLPYAIQIVFHLATVSLVSFIREDRQMRQTGNRLQTPIGNFGLGIVFA